MSDTRGLLESLAGSFKEIQAKQAELTKFKTEAQYEDMLRNKRSLEQLGSLSVEHMSEEEMDRISQEGTDFINASRNRFGFIIDTPAFNHISPMFAGNLIMIGAVSGRGKSTITANVIYGMAIQGKRALVLSNEETAALVYQRVACLHLGLDITKKSEFTEDQIKAIEINSKKFAKRITVIDDNKSGLSGVTTSIEGITHVFDKLLESPVKYDAIVLDYWQGVSASKKMPGAKAWEVQQRLSDYLDQFKNKYPAPILIMSQMHPEDKNTDKGFEERIKGSKAIYVRSTIAFEVKANFPLRMSEWVIHKSRYFPIPPADGSLKVGWERGKFVPYTAEFKSKMEDINRAAQMNRLSGTKPKPGA